jgi:hypothetical protein
MKAERNGQTVTLTMTTTEAADLENELLWVSGDDTHAVKLWEALNALHEKD